jgi:hypothetical protein
MCHMHHHLTPPDLATQIIFTHYAVFSTLLLRHSCQTQVRSSAAHSQWLQDENNTQISGTEQSRLRPSQCDVFGGRDSACGDSAHYIPHSCQCYLQDIRKEQR